ncbi:MAG: hypothetical protein NZ518_07455, partial [Dehalococcoidia bacterium]|nr:hypothetical protein [Dehalococcoidia bacterium]
LGAALAGVALVGLTPLLRPYLGRVAALIAAALLALSPLVWGVSRRADGEAMALLAGLVIALALVRLSDDRHRDQWLVVGAVALACLLTAGPRGVTLLLAMAAFVAIARAAGGGNPFDGVIAAARATHWRRGGPLLWALGVGTLTYTIISTRLVYQPAGVAPPSIRLWVEEVGRGGGGGATLLALASYEPLALLFGVIGIIRFGMRRAAEPRDSAFTALLATWAVVATVVALVGGQATLGPIAAISLPLTLLAATTLADCLLTIRWPTIGRAAAVVGVAPLVVFAYLSLAAYTRPDSAQPVPWLTLGLTVALAAAYLMFVAYATGRDGPPVVGLAVATLAILVSLHTAIELNLRPSAAEWILPDVAGPAAQLIPDQITAITAERGGGAVGVAPGSPPSLVWQTRAASNRVVAEALTPTLPVVVAPAESPPPPGAVAVQRAVFAITPGGPPQTARDFIRWLLWRDATGPRDERVVVLYRRP